MKPATRRPHSAPAVKARPAVSKAPKHWWKYLLGFLLLFFVVLEVYQPALHGPFVFDDLYLPFTIPEVQNQPLSAWLKGVRPVLMLSYWFNYRISGLEPYSYHLLNFIFHAISGALVYAIFLRLLAWAGETGFKRQLLSVLAAGVFLLHPLQTEAVSYIASRSEALTVMLMYGAFAAFLYRRREAIGFAESVAVLMLFGLAVLSKEYAAALPALLLATDYFFGSPRYSFAPIRRNWRLYAPIAICGMLGLAFIWRILKMADTAGFGMKDLPWYQYFYTQCRALWVYIRLFIFPYGQNIDHEFPVSTTILSHGAMFGLLGLAIAAVAAFVYRKRFPLASYGFFVFLILIAPTSSVVPIKDTLVERRVYLPSIGLILIGVEALRRVRLSSMQLAAAAAALLAVFSYLTYQRNQVWSSSIALWQDTAEKSPGKVRPRFQLAFAYYQAGQCQRAVEEFGKAAKIAPPDRVLLVDWALAYDCAQQYGPALEKLQKAAELGRDAHVMSLIGMVHAKQGRREEALAALDAAEKLDSRFDMTYVYRGNLHVLAGDYSQAAAEYQQALSLNPQNESAQRGLQVAMARLPRK